MTPISQLCERARGWASLRADGELSELEAALLDSHLARCIPCRRFAVGAEEVAAALRAARLERPAPIALVVPRRRVVLRGLQVGAAAALVVSAGAVAALAGGDRHGSPPRAVEPVAIVATGESPDALREIRRALLLSQARQVPRNRRGLGETA